MHYNFCTLFDKNYLTRGLSLYQSLRIHAPTSTLWVLCLDDITWNILRALQLPAMQLIRMADFEDPDLQRVKAVRSVAEYCWTLTPSLPRYILHTHPELDHITYLDADIFFFNSPAALFQEWTESCASILIVGHNYANRFFYKVPLAGIYNVEFLIFRNDANSLACLEWWRARCLEWCYARTEAGKFGDQMYLDDWPKRFTGVHVLQHPGGGVAPWNIERFKIKAGPNNTVMIDNLPVIFYHFHAFQWYDENSYDPLAGYYYCPKAVRQLIYKTYYHQLKQALQLVRTVQPKFSNGFRPLSAIRQLIRLNLLRAISAQPLRWLYQHWRN